MPLVSVLLAVHNDARFLGEAVESVLSQTLSDLELILVDDASTDETPELLAAFSEERIVVVRNDERSGLAASLNSGLDRAASRYVARLDADDVALPHRIERQLARIRAEPRVGIVGAGVVDVDAEGRHGRTHVLPQGARPLRWHALFSSPFFHPTVLIDRDVLEQNALRYDAAFLESEDYDLWTRLFAFAEGDNLVEPLVLKRVHAGQASSRRADLQESFQREIAVREISHVAPELSPEDVELAFALGTGRSIPSESRDRAGQALLQLLRAFERAHGVDAGVRRAAARLLARGNFRRQALRLAPTFPLRFAVKRIRRGAQTPRLRTAHWAGARVTVVSPEPTPYRSPLLDRIARTDVELLVIYAARSVASRTWSVDPQHPHVFLRGVRVPGARRLVRHDYPLTLGISRALRQSSPDVVVVSGWSTFASQAAIAWSRAHGIPYVLLVESHDLERRAAWRRAVKGMVVPRLVRGAASVLAVGTAARESVLAQGARPEGVRIFANTIDVAGWTKRAELLVSEHDPGRIVVLSVGRLVEEKGFDLLIRATAEVADERIRLVIAGEGPQREALVKLAGDHGVPLTLLGDLPEDEVAKAYADGDVFALLSRHEPWGVVVTEAAASGLPLVLSDCVGAARDLLLDGENGVLVPAGDVGAAAGALKRLAEDPVLRASAGLRSRELVRAWDYESSVESFLAAVRAATSR